MAAHKVKVIFIDLQAGRDVLARRLQDCQDSLMGAIMVNSQIDIYEEPSSKELDVIPVDTEEADQTVLDQVRWIAEDAVEWI